MNTSYLTAASAFGFICCVLSLCAQQSHVLNILLSLEGIMLCLFFFFFCMVKTGGGAYTSLIFLSLSVIEASMGLAVLVSMVRARGNDYVSSLTHQKC